jgi:hypothetical protein
MGIPSSRLFLATNRFNLLEYLSSGVVLPRAGHIKYYADLNEFSDGRILLFEGGLPKAAAEAVSSESADAFPVILELSVEKTDLKSVPSCSIQDDSRGDAPRMRVFAANGAIPLTAVDRLHFMKAEDESEHAIRPYSNVPSLLSHGIAEAVVLDTPFDMERLRAWSSELDGLSTSPSAFALADRAVGAFIVALHSMVEPSPILLDCFVSLLNKIPDKKGKKKTDIISFLSPEIIVRGVEVPTPQLEERMLVATLTVLSQTDPNKRWVPMEVLESIERSVMGKRIAKKDAEEVMRNLAPIKAILRNEREFNGFKTTTGLAAAKALLLVLLRPEPPRLLTWLPETGSDFVTALFAGMLAGTLAGYRRLPAEYKTAGIHAYAGAYTARFVNSNLLETVRVESVKVVFKQASGQMTYLYGDREMRHWQAKEEAPREILLRSIGNPRYEHIFLTLAKVQNWPEVFDTTITADAEAAISIDSGRIVITVHGPVQCVECLNADALRKRLEMTTPNWQPGPEVSDSFAKARLASEVGGGTEIPS